MGDPKKQRKKYSKPAHPWQKERIEEEKILLKDYGLKNKEEVWKAGSMLANFKRQAKRLIALQTKQAEIEKEQLLKRLNSLSLLQKDAKLESVLSINPKDLLERRLQTIVYKKKLSRTIRQARQFIIHRHILVGDKAITIPSYLVSVDEEIKVGFRPTSALSVQDHPERVAVKEATEEKKKETKERHERKKMYGKRTGNQRNNKKQDRKGGNK